jgi:hypothetical protein
MSDWDPVDAPSWIPNSKKIGTSGCRFEGYPPDNDRLERALASYVHEPDIQWYPSLDWDRRWSETVSIYPSWIGMQTFSPLSWKEIRRLKPRVSSVFIFE